jgi:hypothetical protein
MQLQNRVGVVINVVGALARRTLAPRRQFEPISDLTSADFSDIIIALINNQESPQEVK